MSSLYLLQGILSTQGLNLHFLLCEEDCLQRSHYYINSLLSECSVKYTNESKSLETYRAIWQCCDTLGSDQWSTFSFVACALVVVYKKALSKRRSRITPKFSSKCLIVLG